MGALLLVRHAKLSKNGDPKMSEQALSLMICEVDHCSQLQRRL